MSSITKDIKTLTRRRDFLEHRITEAGETYLGYDIKEWGTLSRVILILEAIKAEGVIPLHVYTHQNKKPVAKEDTYDELYWSRT